MLNYVKLIYYCGSPVVTSLITDENPSPMGDDAVARGFQGTWWTCCWCHLVRIKSIAASPPNAGPEHSWRSTGEHTVQIWYIYIIVYLSGYELCMYRHTYNIYIYLIYLCEQSRITFFGDVTRCDVWIRSCSDRLRKSETPWVNMFNT